MRWLMALLGVTCVACTGDPPRSNFRLEPYPAQMAGQPAPDVPEQGVPASDPTVVVAAPPPDGTRLELTLDSDTLPIPPGRWAVEVEAPGQSFVSVGLLGPQEALKRFDLAARADLRRLSAATALGDDGKLPTFVSFETENTPESMMVVVDVTAPVTLVRTTTARVTERPDAPTRFALVGLPFPLDGRAGYLLQVPARYLFVRADVARALQQAFHQTRVRFRRNLIFVGDASQWNGDRPRTDFDDPRHISHVGGRDVDIGLPSREGPSRVHPRCEGVIVEKDELRCAPGTARGFDAERMAYFLGLLIDGPTPDGRHIADAARRVGPMVPVETIFLDEVYIDEVRNALDDLRRKRWIHEEAYAALSDDGLLRPSPWHTDHVHVRFAGEQGVVPKRLMKEAAE